jgi:hypothetical protein
MTGSATFNHFGSLILKVPPRIEIKVSLRTRDLLEVPTFVAAKAEGILRPLLVCVKQLLINRVAVEKVRFSEKSRKSSNTKCLRGRAKSFVELPDAF